MRVANLYETSKEPVISFEFFPPRDEKAAKNFEKVIDAIATLEPHYMSVTFGAGGTTRDGSFQTVKKLVADKKLPTVAYMAGYGLGPEEITEVLDKYRDLGVETIFVIRGDEPANINQFTPHPDSFQYASDMLSFINQRYDFDLGCAGYPEGHIQAESLDKDIEYLKIKLNNGARYVVTQYFYDNGYFFEYIKKCRAAGISVPIIPGIMPIYSMKMTEMLAKLCGSSITDEIRINLQKLSADEKIAVENYGIDFAVRQCQELLKNGVAGLHFYTMDRSRSVTEIINRLREENLL